MRLTRPKLSILQSFSVAGTGLEPVFSDPLLHATKFLS